MSRLSRFLPRFLRSDKEKKLNHERGSENKAICKVLFLDDTEFNLPYKGGLKGQTVLDKVFEQLNLLEIDYFGLRFIDQTGQAHWLDFQKSLSSQLKGCTLPYTLYFGVKFYPADPCKLREEITRYLFYLQVKRDILHGRLPVIFDEAAALFAYAVQSELGDFDPTRLPPGYISEFQFVPNQTEDLEEQISAFHRRLGGVVPATAELKFLDKVKWFDMYGVDLHPVTGESNTDYFLGLTPTGIVVYKNKTKVGNYFWPRITKVNFKGKVFIVKVKDKINDEHVYAFELGTKAACKHLWKCCVEHHAFFRLNQLGEPPARGAKQFSFTSRHRASGRQERQTNVDVSSREQPQVLRVQSRRQARRAMSDTRLHETETGVSFTEGHITMVVRPERVKGSRHRSLPDLKGRESPRSTRSAPWETNADAGMYTSGRESPISVTQSEHVRYRKNRDSDSESGHRRKVRWGYESEGGRNYNIGRHHSQRSGYDSDPFSGGHRRKYFPSSRKGSDNESDVSHSRRRRRDLDSGSESDISPKYTERQRKAKSMGPDNFEHEMNNQMQHVYIPGKGSVANGSAPSLHSAPGGEARQKRLRRRRSKSPTSNKRPPEELRQHIEFGLVEPGELTEEQMREIPFTNVETKAEPFKVKYSPKTRHRYRSPKRKSTGDLENNMRVYQSDDAPPPYSRTPERTPEPKHRSMPRSSGNQSDTGSFASMHRRSRDTSTQQGLPQYSEIQNARLQQSSESRGTNSVSFSNTSSYMPNNVQQSSKPNNVQQTSRPVSSQADIQRRQEDGITAISNKLNTNRYNSLPQKVNNVQWPNYGLGYTQNVLSTTQHDLLPTPIPPKINHTDTSNIDQSKRSMQDVNSDLGSQGQGQGHDLDEERNHDSGLNSSHGSGTGLPQTPPRNAGNRFGTQNDIARLYSSPQSRMYNGPRGGNQSNTAQVSQPSTQTMYMNQSTTSNMNGTPSNRQSSPSKYDQYNSTMSPYSQAPDTSSYGGNPGYGQTGYQPSYSQNDSSVLQTSVRNQSSQYNPAGQSSHSGQHSNSNSNLLYSQSPMRNTSYSQSNKQNGYATQANGHYSSPSSTSQTISHVSQNTLYNQSPTKSGTSQQTGSPLNSVQRNLFYMPPSTQYTSSSHNQSAVSNGNPNTAVTGNRQAATSGSYIQPSGYTPSAYTQKVSATQGMGEHYIKRASQSPNKSYSSSPNRRQYSSDTIGGSTKTPTNPSSARNHQQNGQPLANQSFASNQTSSSINFRSPDSAIGSTNSYKPTGDSGRSANTHNSFTSGSRYSVMSSGSSPTKNHAMAGQSSYPAVTRAPAFGRSDVWTEI